MEKVIVFESNQIDEIRRIASRLRVKVVEAKKELYGATVGQIAGEVPLIQTPPPFSGKMDGMSLLLFCNVSEKHLDKLLAEFRNANISVEFKAILTPTNRNWNLQRLYFELQKEKAMMQR